MHDTREIDDLILHAEEQLHRTALRTGHLIDHDGQRNLFYIGLFARLLGRMAYELMGEETSMSETECLLVTSMVMVRTLVSVGEPMPDLPPEELERRARTLATKLIREGGPPLRNRRTRR